MSTRRAFLISSSAVAAGLVGWPSLVSGARRQATTYFDWEPLAEGVRLARGGGGAALVVSSDGDSLLIDCKNYGLGTTLRREVEADGNWLVAAVNTHHHQFQIGGNFAFTADRPLIAQRRASRRIAAQIDGVLEALQEDSGGEIIARRRAALFEEAFTEAGGRQAFADFDAHVAGIDALGPADFQPTVTFDEFHSVQVGSLEVQLHHFGRAHTDTDIVVWIPDLELMHVGNLVYLDAHPTIDVGSGADTRSWQRVLQRVAELTGPEATLIPSDGELVGTTHDIETQIDYFDQLRRLAQSAVDANMSREEAVDYLPTTPLARFPRLANPELLPVNLGILYDEIAG